jgi:hypothetical protein
MGVAFGLIVLILLLAGWYYRRQQRKTWVAEERFEESGDWLDKRAGERGTYGSLDAEMEQARLSVRHRGRSIELTRLIRTFAFESVPGFADRSDAEIREFNQLAREQATLLLRVFESGQLTDAPVSRRAADGVSETLKKHILQYAYQEYPTLAERDLEWIRALDGVVGGYACFLIEKMERA